MSAQCFHNGCAGRGWKEFKAKIGAPEPDHYDAPKDSAGDGATKKSQATVLVALILEAGTELWHCPDGVAYATLPAADQHGTCRVRSTCFRQWASRLFYNRHDRVAGAQAIQDAINVLEGEAVHGGDQHQVYVRLAGHENAMYLDLGDPAWRAVEIDAEGWRIVDNPPVKFRRAKALLPLPVPVRGGSIFNAI